MSNLLLYATTVLIWGSTWYAINFQLGVVEPAVSLAYRYAIAAVLSFAVCALLRKRLRFSLRVHGLFLLLGAFLFGFNYLAAYQAQFYISSTLNAIGFSTMIWMNILNARLFFGRRAGRDVYLGAGLGMAGIIVIFLPEVQALSWSDAFLAGLLFSLLGTLFASLGNIASQVVQNREVPVLQANAWGMFYGALLNALLALVQGHAFNWDASSAYAISLLYLAVIGSVVAFACYLTLLGRIGMERAGYAVVMIPVVALAFSVALEGMAVSLNLLVGLMLAVAGNVFILARSGRSVAA